MAHNWGLPIQIKKIKLGQYPSEPMDFDEASFGVLKEYLGGFEFESSLGKINPYQDIRKLFTSRFTFTFWEKGQIDYFFEPLSEVNKMDIRELGETTLPTGETLIWHTPKTSIVLKSGRRNKYLINLKDWVKPSFTPKSIEDIKSIVSKLRLLQEITHIPIKPFSLPQTGSNLLVEEHPEEFLWIRRLNNLNETSRKSIIQAYLNSYYARLEWRYLGTQEVINRDQRKAHLFRMAEVPSLRADNIVGIVTDTNKYPEAHPGSLYWIEVTIPQDLIFGPIPVEGGWPIGYIPRAGPLAKPFLDLLDFMGIPYKILGSYQILIKDQNDLPWKDVRDKLWLAEDGLGDNLYPINLKVLHYTLAGHMQTVYELKDPKTYRPVSLDTTIDFNPVLGVAIKSLCLVSSYREGLGYTELSALREDATSGIGGRNTRSDYVETPLSPTTVVRPNFKDDPGKTIVKDLVHKNRDNYAIMIVRKSWNSIHTGTFKGHLGTSKTESTLITPSHNIRNTENKNGLLSIKVGTLEDSKVDSVPPRWSEDFGLDTNFQEKENHTEFIKDWKEALENDKAS